MRNNKLQAQLRRAVGEGYVWEREHDGLFLYIYTQLAVKERLWNETTCMARGLILDAQGNIVCRPFDKFFNMFERRSTEPDQLPKFGPVVEEKLDGSLLNIWHHKNQWNCSTKGSIKSDHANYVREHILRRYDFSRMNVNWTIMCEAILPQEFRENLVLDYGKFIGLRLLAIRSRHTGLEIGAGRLPILAQQLGMNMRKTFPTPKLVTDLASLMGPGMEGYVVRYEQGLGCDGQCRPFRVKVKNPWYLRIHRALDSKSHRRIIELVEAGEWRAFLKGLPKELQSQFDDIYSEIRTAIWLVEQEADEHWGRLEDTGLVETGKSNQVGRRNFALEVAESVPFHLQRIMYTRLDGHTWKHHVFDIVRKRFKK